MPADALAADLLRFVAAAPTPFHAVAEMARRLEAAGFTRLGESSRWTLAPGDRRYVVRDGGSLAAVVVGTAPPADAGFRLVGAHTDSPVLKVRPRADVRRAGYRLVGVEPYGGVLLHTWLDRDLTLAGRVVTRDDGAVTAHLVRLPGAPLRIPSLAIHLSGNQREEGLRLDPQRHVVPLWAADGLGEAGGLREVVAAAAGVRTADLLAADLVTVDTQPPALGGHADQFVLAPRLDNLASCHAALCALLAGGDTPHTRVVVANDHEEVGSGSAEGARGPFLAEVLRRVVVASGDADAQAFPVAVARSRLVSADMAHAVHPNYAERHEPEHQPRLGGGPVVKHHAGQSYATDAGTAAWFQACCADAGVTVQHFVTRADLPCGSTVGPLTAARLGVATVDVGNPMLSMHSVREQAAAADIAPMVTALRACLASPG